MFLTPQIKTCFVNFFSTGICQKPLKLVGTMKVIRFAACFFLLLVVTLPNESEAVPIAWFLRVAAAWGLRLVKNSYYARCNTRYVPPGMNCPGVVFGVGLSRQQAQASARSYAEMFGDNGCARYVGHCQIYRYGKGNGK